MTSNGQRVAVGAAWTYGAQLATVVLQFGYAAITSRIVSPVGFGHYAIALSVVGLVALLANGGLGQAVSRMLELDRVRIGALASYAVVLGLIGAAATLITAPFWALVWGAPDALPVVQVLAVAGVVSPYQGFITGLLRRTGSFRSLAAATLLGNALGMALGTVAVLIWRSAESLTVSAIAASVLTIGFSMLFVDRTLLGFSRLRNARSDVAYSNRVAISNVLSYVSGNILKIGMTRFIGPASLGYWNRTEVITTVPFQQIQNALIQAVYPEFRHDIASPERARRVWTDLLIAVAWIAMTGGAVAATVLPVLVPTLFGPQWAVTAALVPALAVIAALQLLSVLLSSAIEALGRFRWIWWTEAFLISVQILGFVLMIFEPRLWVPAAALILANVIRHAYQVVLCVRTGYLDGKRLAQQYSFVLLGSAVAAGLCELWLLGLRLSFDGSGQWYLLPLAMLLTVLAVVSAVRWNPVIRIAKTYLRARRT